MLCLCKHGKTLTNTIFNYNLCMSNFDRKLQKPYIVHYMGTSLSKSANKDRPTPIMVMEYCPTNLETIIYNTTKYSAPYRVDDQDRGEDMRPAAKYAFQIASGLQNIHSLGYVHRDLKPANILVRDLWT